MLKNNRRVIVRTVICLLLLALILFLCSCSGGKKAITDYHIGARGLEINFLSQAPPSELYENSSFTATVMVENRGAFDVMNPDYGILSLSFDPFYLSTSDLSGMQNVEVTKNGFIFKGVQLPGKSEYFPTGYQAFISFPYFQTKSILGEREKPSTQLFASLCYPYKTLYAGTACLDFNIYGDNARRQVCSEQDIVLQSQGAPVAITLIETENQPVGQGVRPVFTVHVRNIGSGSVLTNYDNAPDLDRVCTLQDLYKEDFNMVGVKATLSTNKQLICNPNPIKLFNGEGVTRCVVSDQDLVLGNTNYEALLSIELDYIYLTSVSKTVEIKRLNQYGGPSGAPSQCLPTEVAEGDRCITRCDYCARNGGGGDCSVPADALHPDLRVNFQIGFGCYCTYADCINLYPDGLCIPTTNFCPGASYCCMPACRSTEVRINGTCYPKCSAGITCSGLTTKQCACGTGTDPNAYRLVQRDVYCCPLYASTYTDSVSCKSACVRTNTTI